MLNAKIYFHQIVGKVILLIKQNIRHNAKKFSLQTDDSKNYIYIIKIT